MSVKYLTDVQVKRLTAAAKDGRHPVRDQLIILMMYRHGLRVSELVGLRLDQLRLDQALVDISRLKGSIGTAHPIEGDELRLIRRYLKVREDESSPWLFLSDRKGPLTRQAINYMLNKLSEKTGVSVCPKMFRHGCGFYLANKGVDLRRIQAYLGHTNVQNTVIYTQLTGRQFRGMWSGTN